MTVPDLISRMSQVCYNGRAFQTNPLVALLSESKFLHIEQIIGTSAPFGLDPLSSVSIELPCLPFMEIAHRTCFS